MMRLFNRRKEMEFDDPRLVGMAPLKATEETFGHQQQQEQQQTQNISSAEEGITPHGRVPTITGRKSSSSINNDSQLMQQDKYGVANGKSLHNMRINSITF
jgi:hypothetical protein